MLAGEVMTKGARTVVMVMLVSPYVVESPTADVNATFAAIEHGI